MLRLKSKLIIMWATEEMLCSMFVNSTKWAVLSSSSSHKYIMIPSENDYKKIIEAHDKLMI